MEGLEALKKCGDGFGAESSDIKGNLALVAKAIRPGKVDKSHLLKT